MSKDVISLSISVLLLFRHYISHKITFGAPSSGGVLCSACGAFIYFGFWKTGQISKLEDLKVLKRSPDLLNNVKIGNGQLRENK